MLKPNFGLMIGLFLITCGLGATSKREEFFKKNLCLTTEEIQEIRGMLSAKRSEVCSDDEDLPGCRQAAAFIKKIDQLLEDGALPTHELFEPAIDALLVFFAHAKNQLSREQVEDMMVYVSDHPDIDIEIPVDDTDDEEDDY